MGRFVDWLFGPEEAPLERRAQGPIPDLGMLPRSELAQPVEPADPMLAMIARAVEERTATFGIRDAMRLPSVIRGVQLLCSTVAAFAPLAYRDGVALEAQPRILRRFSPFGTRYAFLYGTMYALLAGDENGDKHGNAFWWITDRDDERQPRAVILLPGSEVQVSWDERRFQRVYVWRGRQLAGEDVVHVELGRKPGALLGCSPIAEGLEALAGVAAAEQYAASWFWTSGVPTVTLRVAGKMTALEAETLKAQYMSSRSGPIGTPAVLSGGITDEYPEVDPQAAQLQQARDYGNTVTARLLGIPAPLLHVATSGATITYTNTAAAIEELVRATIAPTYLPPIEGAASELVPSTQAVRFDTRELLRVDVAARFGIYQLGIDAGIFGPEDARTFEGWPRTGPVGGSLFAAVPAAPPAPRPSQVPVA